MCVCVRACICALEIAYGDGVKAKPFPDDSTKPELVGPEVRSPKERRREEEIPGTNPDMRG